MADAIMNIDMRASRLRLGGVWSRLTLARRFTVAAAALSLASVLVLGSWVSRTLEEGIIDSAGVASAVYIGHFLAPHLQELATGRELTAHSVDALDRINESVGANMRLHSMKVWLQDGEIVYSRKKELVGKVFLHDSLTRAWNGFVTTEFNQMHQDENFLDRGGNLNLLEVYAPIYSENSGEVIAVAEFYELADNVDAQLVRVKWQSWLVTGLLAAAMIFALFSIVADGSRTIERQRSALTARISELSALLQQNRALRDRVKRGARQVVEDQEHFLRRIGSDLHDGPAQLIGLALLRLDPLYVAGGDGKAVHEALADALNEIRNISAGLLLPEARDQNLEEALRRTIRDHERRTRTAVSFLVGELASEPPGYVNQCLCRVVQEGLSNAFRHAGGKGQGVAMWSDGRSISVEVHDEGPGFSAACIAADHRHMGLLSLRGRVESIGGTLTVACPPRDGTRLTASLPMREEE